MCDDYAKAFIDAGGRAVWEYIVFAHNEHQVEEARNLADELGFEKFQVKKSARFLSTNGSLKESIHSVDKKGNENILMAPRNPKYRNSAIEQIAGSNKVDVKLPTTKKELLGLIGPESFGNTTIYDTATIKCKVKEEKSIYVSAEGILQPCCWVAGQMYNWHNTPKGSQVWKLINVVGKDSLNALNHSVAEIVTGLYFQKLISDSWTKPSCSEGKLKVCAKICGEETDVFSKQYT